MSEPEPAPDAAPAGDWSVADAAGVELGEHPVWDDRRSRLGWVDVHGGTLRWWSPAGAVAVEPFAAPLGAVGLRERGGVIAAAGSCLAFHDGAGRVDRDPITVSIPHGVRFNDAACDPQGRFLFGTAAVDGRAGAGSLYRVDARGAVRELLTGITESNGLGWSADGTTMYYVDSGEPVVRTYAYPAGADGAPVRGRDLFVGGDAGGVPDGLAVDAEGSIWIALWEGHALLRVGPDGSTISLVELPVSRPTCPAFGGPHLDRLFVSTAWEGLDVPARAREPWAGHLLTVVPGVRGRPAHRFAA